MMRRAAAVQIDQRRGRLGHVAHEENHRAAFQGRQMRAERGGPREIVERQDVLARRHSAAEAGAALHQPRERQRLRQGTWS